MAVFSWKEKETPNQSRSSEERPTTLRLGLSGFLRVGLVWRGIDLLI